MKVPFFVGLIIVVLVLAVTIIVALGANVPSELLASVTTLVGFFVGVASENPSK